MNTINNNAGEHQDIEELLPWHAAGTLSRRDAQRVEEALANDSELARRYEMVREELAETILLNETLGAPSARAMQTLFAKIEAEAPRKAKISLNVSAWLAGFAASFSPRTLAYAGTAAVLAIVLQAAVITGVFVSEYSAPSGYQTASFDAGTTGTFAMVRFAPQVSAAELTAFLDNYKATVVEGPRAGGMQGMFRVRLAATKLSKDEAAGIIKRMQGDKVIGFIALKE